MQKNVDNQIFITIFNSDMNCNNSYVEPTSLLFKYFHH